MSPWILVFLQIMLESVPNLAVSTVGIILALVWWQRHPRVSLLTLMAISLGLLTFVMGTALLVWIPIHLIDARHWKYEQTIPVSTWIVVIRNCIGAVSGGLTLCAIFTGRSRKASGRKEDS